MDGRSEPGTAVDLGQQRPAGCAQRLDPARGPGHRVRAVFAAHAEPGDQGVRVLGRGVQQPAQVRVQARGHRHGQGSDQDTQSSEGRRPTAQDDRLAVAVARGSAVNQRQIILHLPECYYYVFLVLKTKRKSKTRKVLTKTKSLRDYFCNY